MEDEKEILENNFDQCDEGSSPTIVNISHLAKYLIFS